MKSARLATLAAAACVLAACDTSSRALGTATSIIVIATDSVWTAIGDSIYAVLEPRIRTVREERTFEVTHVPPADPRWQELREFRQVVAIGAAEDAWVAPILAEANGDAATGVVSTYDVWARDQLAFAIVTPTTHDGAAALPHLD